MTPQKLLTYLPRDLVEPITRDVAQAAAWQMLGPDKHAHEILTARVLEWVFLRWGCALQKPVDEAASQGHDLVCLTLAAVLHRHGFCDDALTRSALDAVDRLNRRVVLSDAFERNSTAIKALLGSLPKPLARRPPLARHVTFWREGDAASVQVGEWFYAIHVHAILGNHEAPVVELYDFVSRQPPVAEDLRACKAKGQLSADGVLRISRHAVYGLRDLPDRAGQFCLIASDMPAPSVAHLQPSAGLFGVSDPFTFLEDMRQALGHG